MALVNSSFTVNVTPGAMPPIVHVSEYDIGRTYTVTINGQNGSAFNIPSGTTATVEGTLNGVIGFTTGATISGSNVSFALTESMTARSGKAWCKIKLTLNNEPIQTCAFVLAVDRAGLEAETVIGADGFNEQIQDAVDNYLEEHPVPTVTVDPTLAISGAAADAKVTGDEIGDLKSAVDDVEYDVGILKSFHKNDLTWAQIKNIVQTGHAQDWFQIGDQIEVNWTKGSTRHSLPFDVVSFDPVIKEGSSDPVPGLWLQSHYAMDDVQFGASRAAYYCLEALAAGTYIFEITMTWSQAVAGKYQFTTTQEIPAGGQIVIGRNNDFYTWAAPVTAPANWKVHTFSTVGSTTPLETNLEVTTVSEGTTLFTLSSAAKYNANGEGNLHSCGYGYNRWAFSSMRKWLNSDAVAGQWWVASDNADRPAQQLATLDGFMKGFESDFLSALGKVKVTTALNTVSDTDIGASEDTYDTFFLASLEQEYIVPQAAGVEGAYWPYWKERLGLDSPQIWYGDGTNAHHIRYAYDARTSAQFCRLRSALRGTATNPWHVNASGVAGSTYATNAARGCPACVIC